MAPKLQQMPLHRQFVCIAVWTFSYLNMLSEKLIYVCLLMNN